MVGWLYRRHPRFARYALVGLSVNAAGYVLYLSITQLGLEPTVAMTLLYCAGVLAGFVGNRKWTFRHQGAAASSLLRYLLAHVAGYAINYALLQLLCFELGYPHQMVQAFAIIVVAVFLFAAFKFFAFRDDLGFQDDRVS